MPHFYQRIVPVAGLLLIQPLPGDGRASAADLVKTEVKKEEEKEDILPWLGRADLLDPVKPPAAGEEPEVKVVPDEDPVGDAPPLPEEVTGDPAEPVVEGEAGETVAPILPKSSAGDGPGVVEGVVSDADGKGIPGVIVTLPDQGAFQVRTGPDGSFRITGLPAQGVRAEFLKPSYEIKVDVLQIREDGVTKVIVPLELKPIELAEGEYLLEGQEIILDPVEEPAQIEFGAVETPGLVSGIGKEEFAKQSVTNAADAVGRVSGANIVDGRYAVVRGLADRYVTTSFNNGAITSADPSRKTVQLDLFPTSVLEGIGVKKVYDASMPGDFGGGAINIQTLAMPQERFLKLDYRWGWNSNLEDNFIRSQRSLGFSGSVDNPVDLGGLFDPSQGFPSGSNSNAPDPETEAVWDKLLSETNFVGRESAPRPSQKFGLSFGDRFELNDRVSLGIVTALSHSTEDRMQLGRIRDRPGNERFWVQDDYSSIVEWGAFFSAQLEIDESQKLRASYFRKRVAEDIFSIQRDVIDQRPGISLGFEAQRPVRDGLPAIPGVRPAIPGYGADAFFDGEAYQTNTTIRDLELIQFSGEHEFWEDGLTFNWGFTRNNSSESRPYSTALRYGVLDFTDPRLAPQGDPLLLLANRFNDRFNLGLTNPTFEEMSAAFLAVRPSAATFLESQRQAALANAGQFNPDLGRVPTLGSVEYNDDSPSNILSEIISQRIEEVTNESYADFLLPLKLAEDKELRFGGGIRSSEKRRESRGQRYVIDANGLPDEDLYTPGGLGSQIPLDPSRFVDGTNGGNAGITIEDGNDIEIRNFDGNSDLMGMYFKGELDWGPYTFGAGIRREEETRGYFTLPVPFNLSTSANERESVTNITNIPSFYLKRHFNEERIRVGAFFSRTVARPTFFEFLPARTIEQDTEFIRIGNFDLNNTEITNVDLSFEWDVTDNSRFSISPFYKHLDQPIITVVRRGQQTISFQNGEEGTLRGFELEFELGEFKPFTFKGNYTFIDADLLANINSSAEGAEPVDLQFPNQPEHILNLSLGYENEETGWSSNLVYNLTGENAIFLRESESDANVITPTFQTFDFNLRKTFEHSDYDITLGLSVRNLFDETAKIVFEGGGASFADRVFDIRDSGRTIFLEGSIAF